jgi:hypothetical protein
VSLYLDANVMVALLTPEPLSTRADDFECNNPEGLIVSDFAAAEFASADCETRPHPRDYRRGRAEGLSRL